MFSQKSRKNLKEMYESTGGWLDWKRNRSEEHTREDLHVAQNSERNAIATERYGNPGTAIETLGLLDGSRISDYTGDCIIREPWDNESTLTIPLPTLLEAWLHGV
jgi:hypothetical protein